MYKQIFGIQNILDWIKRENYRAERELKNYQFGCVWKSRALSKYKKVAKFLAVDFEHLLTINLESVACIKV